MATGSGISSQLGIKAESVYGTPVTVDRFYEFVNESMKMSQERVESQGLRAGLRVGRSNRWGLGTRTVGGDIEMEVATKNFGLWFAHMLGTTTPTQPDVAGNPTVWDHTATPGDLTGKMLTVQIGKPDVGGTVNPFTYHGCKVASWSLGCAVDEIAKLTVSLIGEDEETGVALASASYPSGDSLFVFTQGTLTIAGSAYDVTEATIQGDNKLKDDRFRLGATTRKEPLENEMREFTGELSSEFLSLAAYNRFVAGTEAALVLLFEGATITGIYKYTLRVTMNVRFDGETPEVSGPEVLEQPLQFKALNSGAGDSSAISILYRTTDSAA